MYFKQNIVLKIGLCLIFFVLFAFGETFGGTCCERGFDSRVTAPASVPAVDVRMMRASADSGFTYKGPREANCPLILYLFKRADNEYLLDCNLTIMPSDKKGGRYILPIPDDQVNYHIFTAKLVDPHHGNAIVAGPGKVQWHGGIIDHTIHNPTGGSRDLIKELIQSLRPFDEKIYDYERLPESCTIEPEKDEVEGGETINIEIKELKDHKGRQAKYFQRILVKADIGEIKNGFDKDPYYVFEVGSSGSVTVVYKAPEKCDFDTEMIKVYNSCNWTHGLESTVIEDKIGEKEIKVDDFRPVSCKITPEKKKLEPGSVSTVKLTDFKEQEDRELRPDEKIMVKVDKGKLLNGQKHGEYHIFKIGSGKVDVEYEAPDLCGLDSDQMTVKNVCEDPEKGTIEPDQQIAEKKLALEKTSCDLSVHIRAAFQWRDEQGNAVVEGNAQMEVNGSMKFDDSIGLPYVKRYTPENLVVSWSKKVKSIEKKPNENCPEVLYEYSGGGSSAIPDPAYKQSCAFEIHRFGDLFPKNLPVPIPEQAKSQMVDSYQLVLVGVKQQMRGRYRKGTYCNEDFCPCKDYEKKEPEIGVGSIFIRFPMEKDGSMSGRKYWVAHGGSLGALGFSINAVGDLPELKPKPLEKMGDSVLNVTVSWDFKANR